MRIRNLLSQSFTNPLGNLLAAANLLMVLSLALGMPWIDGKFVYDLNRPALLAGLYLGGKPTAVLFVLQFIYLQWIFIGGFAKFLAALITPPEVH
jgi:hypothetical protein